MRLTGGVLRGQKLATEGAGKGGIALRPTADRAREALFNILAHGDYPPLEGAFVVDIFAGTGALGLEAVSRGARRAVFVENSNISLRILRQNIAKAAHLAEIELMKQDARHIAGAQMSADFLFLDPPYGRGLGVLALAEFQKQGWLHDGSIVVLEEADFQPAPADFTKIDQRRYGAAHLHFWRYAPQS